MDCLHETASNDEELIAFALDDEILSPEAQHHLEQCAICQRTNAYLVARFYPSQCPTSAAPGFYSVGGLSPQDHQRIASHLLDCPLCMGEVEEARRFLAQPIEFPTPAFSQHALVRCIFATRVTHILAHSKVHSTSL